MKILFSFLLGLSVLQAQVKDVKIGTQVWMDNNLDVTTFRNGDPIPQAKTAEEWKKADENKQPAWCYFNNDPANGEKYGKLYNVYAVNDKRGLAPQGYHIPTDAEWPRFYSDSEGAWKEIGNGSGASEFFSSHPGCMRFGDGVFDNAGGCWWTSAEADTSEPYHRCVDYYDGHMFMGPDWNNSSEGIGLFVRCLRD